MNTSSTGASLTHIPAIQTTSMASLTDRPVEKKHSSPQPNKRYAQAPPSGRVTTSTNQSTPTTTTAHVQHATLTWKTARSDQEGWKKTATKPHQTDNDQYEKPQAQKRNKLDVRILTKRLFLFVKCKIDVIP